jgi:urease accessory protein
LFSNLKTGDGLEEIVGWIKKYALLQDIEEPNLLR